MDLYAIRKSTGIHNRDALMKQKSMDKTKREGRDAAKELKKEKRTLEKKTAMKNKTEATGYNNMESVMPTRREATYYPEHATSLMSQSVIMSITAPQADADIVLVNADTIAPTADDWALVN
jgi:hypothetical protein